MAGAQVETTAIEWQLVQDMLGESFRRQILMDGQYGNIIFVATQSDSLIRTEIAENLGLPNDASIEECARKHNEYTKARIQEDFIDGYVHFTALYPALFYFISLLNPSHIIFVTELHRLLRSQA